MKGAPPRVTGDLNTWARKLVDYLWTQQLEKQLPRPVAPQLLYVLEAEGSAFRDGVLLFDSTKGAPVVSRGAGYDPVAMESNTPQRVDVPATATSSGTVGQIAWDDTHAYFCTATDTWRRVAIASW